MGYPPPAKSMDDEKELTDSQTPLGTEEPKEPEGTETATEPEPVARQDFDKVYARAKKAEEENKALKKRLETSPSATGEFDIEEVVDLRISGLSKDEISYMKSFAKGSGKSLSEVSKDPFVLAGIEGMRTRSKSDEATPPPSSRTSSVSSTKKAWADMSAEDRKANFGSHSDKFFGKKRSFA